MSADAPHPRVSKSVALPPRGQRVPRARAPFLNQPWTRRRAHAKIDIAFPGNNRHFLSVGSGRSVAWLARLFRVQEVVSSNLTAPTIFSFRDGSDLKSETCQKLWNLKDSSLPP